MVRPLIINDENENLNGVENIFERNQLLDN